MNKCLSVIIILLPLFVTAEIQVPENCVNNVSPCLVRSDSKPFVFKQGELKIVLVKNSIIKIIEEGSHINIEILKGFVDLQLTTKMSKTVSVNSVLIESVRSFTARDRDQLKILSHNNYVQTVYQLMSYNAEYAERIKSQFLSKTELVELSRHFFVNTSELKLFLKQIEKNWLAEFKRQNETQTKVLTRSIASEEKAVEERLKKQEREQAELKKLKKELFFRTFNR